jgi:malate synthase
MNLEIILKYYYNWMMGNGAISNLGFMEDLSTAELCRA